MVELLLIGMGIALICGVVSLVFNAIEEGVEHIWGTKEKQPPQPPPAPSPEQTGEDWGQWL